MIAQKSSGGPMWSMAGAGLIIVALATAYYADPAYMNVLQVAFDRLVMWARVIAGAAAVLVLVSLAPFHFLRGKHSEAYHVAMGCFLTAALAAIAPTAMHWFGTIVSNLVAGLPISH